MVGVKNQSESVNSSVSPRASQQVGVFVPQQHLSGLDGSTRIALNFTPSLFRTTPSNSSSSLSEMASDSSTSSRKNSDTEIKSKRRGSNMSRSQVSEAVRLVLCSFSSKISNPRKLKEESRLSAEFGFNFLDLISLVKTLGKTFNFRIFEDEIDSLENQLQTPHDIVNFICQKLGVSF